MREGRRLPFLIASARRDLASRRGLRRCPDHFLGLVVSTVSRPSRFGFAETLVPVATIRFSGKPRVPHVALGFKDKTRYTLYVSPGSQFSHIATNKGNIKRQYLLHNVLVKGI